MGRQWRLKVEPVRCSSAEECLEACRRQGMISVTPETLLLIADKLPRDCAVLVEAGSSGPPG